MLIQIISPWDVAGKHDSVIKSEKRKKVRGKIIIGMGRWASVCFAW